MKKLLMVLIVSFCCILCACGAETQVLNVEGIEISTKNLYLAEGQTNVISAQVFPFNATNQNAKWYSSDKSIVTVEDGFVKAVSAGEAVIEVFSEDGGFRDSCNVLVTTAGENLALTDFNNLNMPFNEEIIVENNHKSDLLSVSAENISNVKTNCNFQKNTVKKINNFFKRNPLKLFRVTNENDSSLILNGKVPLEEEVLFEENNISINSTTDGKMTVVKIDTNRAGEENIAEKISTTEKYKEYFLEKLQSTAQSLQTDLINTKDYLTNGALSFMSGFFDNNLANSFNNLFWEIQESINEIKEEFVESLNKTIDDIKNGNYTAEPTETGVAFVKVESED